MAYQENLVSNMDKAARLQSKYDFRENIPPGSKVSFVDHGSGKELTGTTDEGRIYTNIADDHVVVNLDGPDGGFAVVPFSDLIKI